MSEKHLFSGLYFSAPCITPMSRGPHAFKVSSSFGLDDENDGLSPFDDEMDEMTQLNTDLDTDDTLEDEDGPTADDEAEPINDNHLDEDADADEESEEDLDDEDIDWKFEL